MAALVICLLESIKNLAHFFHSNLPLTIQQSDCYLWEIKVIHEKE